MSGCPAGSSDHGAASKCSTTGLIGGQSDCWLWPVKNSTKKMIENLLKWLDLDSDELRILLHERIGGIGQGDISERRPSKLYFPMAGPSCLVIFRFDGPNIIAIEQGQGFDKTQWEQISNEIEHSILKGPTRIGREYSFSGRRVTGSWRGTHSGVQIYPPPHDLPRVPVESGDHPFILEFPLMAAGLGTVTNHRRLRKHRDLTFLLNVLLVGGAKSMGFRFTHCWAGREWVQQWFSPQLNPPITDALSEPAAAQLEELEPEQYDAMPGNDGMGLRVPSDLDQSICSYDALSAPNRVKFDRAAFWFGTASRMWDVSVSASFAAFVSAIESLTVRGGGHALTCPVCGRPTHHEIPGPTKLFKRLLETFAPGATLARDRTDMYGLRSSILHGEHLMESDREIPMMGWTPPGSKEIEQYSGLWRVTRTALRNWLKSPPPQSSYLQQARRECAYFHWIERGCPLWQADVDWEWAEQEFPTQ